METEKNVQRLSARGYSYWGLAMALCVILTYGLSIYAPSIYAKTGTGISGGWFSDARSVLLCSDMMAAGVDPTVPNPVAIHFYSSWWFYLFDIGLTAKDYAWVGLGIGLAFLFTAIMVIGPVSAGGALIGFLFLVSPAVQLGFNRGNVDLLIFCLLAPVPFLLTRLRWWCFLAPVVIAFCAGLKFYPIVAGVVLVFVSKPRRVLLILIWLMIILAGLVAISVEKDYLRVAARMPSPIGLYNFGGSRLFGLVGVPTWAVQGCCLVLLGFSAAFWIKLKIKITDGLSPLRVASFVLGASILLGCFIMGNSFLYRLVFAFFMIPLLLELAGAIDATPARIMARVGLGLLGFLLWVDGGFGFAIFESGKSGDGSMRPVLEAAGIWVSVLADWVWVLVVEGLLIAVMAAPCKRLWGGPGPEEPVGECAEFEESGSRS